MHLTAILLLCFNEVITEVNSGSNRTISRSLPKLKTNISGTVDSTLKGIIFTDLRNTQPILDQNESNELRENVLLPELDSSGRPSCVTTPDDTFCEDVNNYPQSYIEEEIEYSSKEFLEIFGINEIDESRFVESTIDEDILEERVCGRIPRLIVPKMAKNQENQWIYVVNEIKYTQAVDAEICQKAGNACDYLDENLPPGKYSECRQKYSYKRLLALHPTKKGTYTDTFKFPSYCACYVKSNESDENLF